MRRPTRRFALGLARELGYANVDRMLAGMTSRQLSEWMAYARIEADDMQKQSLAARAEAGLASVKAARHRR